MEIFFWSSVERKQVSGAWSEAAVSRVAERVAERRSFNARAHKRQALFRLSKARCVKSKFNLVS